MPDDEVTAVAAGESPPTSDLGPAPAADGPLAYSEHTTSMPVTEYQPPRLRPGWIIALVLAAAAAVAAAMFVLGRTTAPQETAPPPPAPTSSPVRPPVVPPPVAAPPPAPVAPPAAAVPPTVTVTAVPPAPPTTSVPPLATPQARIAEPIICSLHSQYPQMQPVDLALTLVDRGIYRTYADAQLVVDLVLKDGCHGI